MEQNKYSLIIAIVNTGFSELVMEAARDNGAQGGTVAHCRGTGTKEMEQMYGVTISEGKEMIMIVVKKNVSDKILKAINDAAGLQTLGRGIAFSIPVDNVAGIKSTEKLDKIN